MTTVHVCVVSDQPLANLIPALWERPQRVILLVSPEMKPKAIWQKRILRAHGIEVEDIEIDGYSFGSVAAACRRVIEGENASCTLNVTGGTKIAALAAYQEFFFADRRIIYQDTANDRLLTLGLDPRAEALSENLLSVRECLAAYGFGMKTNGSPPAGARNRSGILRQLVNLLVLDERLLGSLNATLDDHKSRDGSYANLPLNALGEKADLLCDLLERGGVGTRTGAALFNIPAAEKVFFCHGGWLEEYVHQVIKDLRYPGLDLGMNVKVEWEGPGPNKTSNEFDVLFTFRNRLHVISCKAANLQRTAGTGSRGKGALYELETLSDRAAGLYGKKMLISAQRLSDAVLKRAADMKVRVAAGPEILRLDSMIREWIG